MENVNVKCSKCKCKKAIIYTYYYCTNVVPRINDVESMQ